MYSLTKTEGHANCKIQTNEVLLKIKFFIGGLLLFGKGKQAPLHRTAACYKYRIFVLLAHAFSPVVISQTFDDQLLMEKRRVHNSSTP